MFTLLLLPGVISRGVSLLRRTQRRGGRIRLTQPGASAAGRLAQRASAAVQNILGKARAKQGGRIRLTQSNAAATGGAFQRAGAAIRNALSNLRKGVRARVPVRSHVRVH